MIEGIYILANDFVYNQLVALLNSIEANISREILVCIIPYDDRLDKVRAEIATRPQVTLFENVESIQRWETFATEVWKSHDRAQHAWRDRQFPEVYRLAMHRKLCCFDGEFDKFIYFDADTLAMGAVAPVFQQLNSYDWVTNDYQYSSDIKYIFDASKEALLEVFDSETLKSNIFCAGWFASKKNLFTNEVIQSLLQALKSGESDLLALWGTDQSLMNYMVMRSKVSYYNFALHAAPGSHWSSKFDEIDHILYDKDDRLTYLHYMSISSAKFNQLCAGEDVDIPYHDLFLHYRYLNSPQDRLQTFRKPPQIERVRSLIVQFYQRKMSNFRHRFRQIKKVANL